MSREDFIRNNTVEEIGEKEFLNSLLFAINEMRAGDIGKMIENNPDFINLIRDINKNTTGKDNYNLERAIFKIVNLVQNIAYIEGFKDGMKFHNDILKEDKFLCPVCKGNKVLPVTIKEVVSGIDQSCPECSGNGYIKINKLIESLIRNGDI